MRVLLADDHQILRDGIRRGLEAAGEEVVGEADNGEQALELVRETRPDIVIMDLTMPVLDGVTATRRITEEFTKNPQCQILIAERSTRITPDCFVHSLVFYPPRIRVAYLFSFVQPLLRQYFFTVSAAA